MSTLFVNTIQPNSGDTVTVSGSLTTTGKLTIGDASTDTVAFEAEISSSLIPDLDDTYNLGSISKQWQNLYLDGTAFIDDINNSGNILNLGTISTFAINSTTSSVALLAASGGSDIDIKGNMLPNEGATYALGTMAQSWGSAHIHGLAHIHTASINQVTSSLIPSIHNTVDLGSSIRQWKNLWVSNAALINTIYADVTHFDDVKSHGSASIDGALTANTVSASAFNTAKFTAASQDLNSSENYTVNGNKVEVRAILKENLVDGTFAKFSLLNSSIATDSIVLGSFTGGTAGLITGSIITAATTGASTASVQIHNETGIQINADTGFTASFVVL